MYSTQFLTFLRHHFRICKWLRCTPFTYNSQTGKLVQVKNFSHLKQFKLQCVLSICYCLAMISNLCFGTLTIADKFQGLVFFLMYLTVAVMRWNFNLDISGMQIVNSFIDFESHILQGN